MIITATLEWFDPKTKDPETLPRPPMYVNDPRTCVHEALSYWDHIRGYRCSDCGLITDLIDLRPRRL